MLSIRRVSLLAALIAALAVLVACTGSQDSEQSAFDPSKFDEPGSAPVLSTESDVVTGLRAQVTANDLRGPAGLSYYLQDRLGATVLAVFVLSSDDPINPTGQLRDGTPVQMIGRSQPNQTATATYYVGENRVEMLSRVHSVDELLELADIITFAADGELDASASELTVVTSLPTPSINDGYSTTYEFPNGQSVTIEAHTMLGDEYYQYDFGPTLRTTVFGDVRALELDTSVSDSLGLVYRHPGTSLFVRVQVNPHYEADGNLTLTLDMDDLRDVVANLRFDPPLPT